MSVWEFTEKPKRKGKTFAVVIREGQSFFTTSLEYYGSKPVGSLGYLDRDFTNTKNGAQSVGKLMLKKLKKGGYDRAINEDLKRGAAYAKFNIRG